jgi:hypothetical protein
MTHKIKMQEAEEINFTKKVDVSGSEKMKTPGNATESINPILR